MFLWGMPRGDVLSPSGGNWALRDGHCQGHGQDGASVAAASAVFHRPFFLAHHGCENCSSHEMGIYKGCLSSPHSSGYPPTPRRSLPTSFIYTPAPQHPSTSPSSMSTPFQPLAFHRNGIACVSFHSECWRYEPWLLWHVVTYSLSIIFLLNHYYITL